MNLQGSIMIFLDAHMECTQGWLEPLVARIANDRSVVAVPLIDFISPKDMSYIAPYTAISMFRWNLIFNWFVQFPISNGRMKDQLLIYGF